MEYVYSKVNRKDLRDRLIEVSQKSINNSFGMFFSLRGGDMQVYSISPPSAGIRGETAPIESGVFETYEICLSDTSFLTLNTEVNRGLDYHLSNLSKFMLPNEKIVIQIAARKLLGNGWREELLDMYSSYLRGNDSPLTSSIGRKVQEKAIGILGRLGNFELSKEYVDDVEDKILDTGYEFRIMMGILSREPSEIAERVVSALRVYDSYNSLRPHKIKHDIYSRGFDIKRGLLTSNTSRSILSEKELLTLLVGSEVDATDSLTIEIPETVDEERSEFDFLPEVKRPRETMHEMDKINLISQIAGALKEVGVLSVARLYNEKVIEGVRLIVVQFDVPKGKNFSDIQKKRKDIQVALGIHSLSIEQGDSPGTVKFSIPNDKSTVIGLRELIESESFKKFRSKNDLAFVVGADETSNPIYLSLTKLVHLLVAGTTGSGKSVFINSLATALISTNSPDELQLIMIDPKMVELQHYKGLPHVRDVITDMNKAERALGKLVVEMDRRYEEFQRIGVKNIELYNESKKKDELMPYLVCIIDEYADLKDTNPEVEGYIGRLGQKARAAGIHMVIATQRPDVKVISGKIKAVIPNAISFSLNNNRDYQTVFGAGIGDVTLLGRGDGMMRIEGYEKHLQRFQSCIISPDESEEEKVYKRLAERFGVKKEEKLVVLDDVEEKTVEEEVSAVEETEIEQAEDSPLDELKKIIARTKETRMTPLRKELGGRMERLQELMQELVDEGWLMRHENRSKGYELVAEEDELKKWR